MAGIWNDPKFLLFISGASIQVAAYLLGQYYTNRNGKNVDEGFEDVSRIEETAEKKILMLGLEGAGKSTLLSQFTGPAHVSFSTPSPTTGFNVITLDNDGVILKIYEIGGKAKDYWFNYLQDTEVFVFVVDSTKDLIQPGREIKRLLGDERLNHVPVVILAHKQDKPGALNETEVGDSLDLKSIPPRQHKVIVLPTQCPPNSTKIHKSVIEAKRALFQLTSD